MDAFIIRKRPTAQLFEKERAAFVSLDATVDGTHTEAASFAAHGGTVAADASVVIVPVDAEQVDERVAAIRKRHPGAKIVSAEWVSACVARKQRLPFDGYVLLGEGGTEEENGEGEPDRKKQRRVEADRSDGTSVEDAPPNLTRAWKTVSNGSLHFWDARASDDRPRHLKLAAFDMDGTLIVTKSGKRFAQDANDWALFHATKVVATLRQLHADGFTLVLLSNQNGVEKGKTEASHVQQKMMAIVKKLTVPMLVLFATKDDEMRKPRIGAWRWLLEELGNPSVDMKESFYCGDAAGRPKIAGRNKDFAATDYKFALNADLAFHTPEALFLQSTQRIHTRTDMWDIGFDPRHLPVGPPLQLLPATTTLEMVLVVGPPASGKSFVAAKFTGYEYVCQDELKTVAKCLIAAKKALEQGRSLVVDCTNRDAKTRREWIVLAQLHHASVRCLVMDVEKPLSMHLNTFRKLTSAKDVPDVAIHTFFKNYVAPDSTEGFDALVKVAFSVEVSALSTARAELIRSFL